MSMHNTSNGQYKYSEAVKNSRLKMPDMAFEEKVMLGVELEVERRQDRRYLVYAIISLVGFTLSGVVIIAFMNHKQLLISGAWSGAVGYIARSLFVLVILVLVDRILLFRKRYRAWSPPLEDEL